jgi:hypothetical protein
MVYENLETCIVPNRLLVALFARNGKEKEGLAMSQSLVLRFVPTSS